MDVRSGAWGLDDVLSRVREFGEKQLAERDRGAAAPGAQLEMGRSLHSAGLANWWLPTRYGGLGLDTRESVDVVSELAYRDAGAAFTLFISIIGTTMVSLYGGPALRDELLGAMGRSGGFSAALGSEREAGSELGRTATTATVDGGGIVLDGEKFFSTNADFADFLVVVARSAGERFVAVVVPRDTPGVRVVKRWDMIGLESAATYQVAFEHCRVPAANLLDGPGLGLLEIGLNPSRVLIAAVALGLSRRVRDVVLDYARGKPLQGSMLIDHPVFGAKIGQMEMCIDVMRNQCLAAAAEFDALAARPDAPAELLRRGALRSCIAAKMFCGQAGWELAGTGSELLGGLGYTEESELGGLVRDMRFVSIVEGGDDVLRELMFRRFVRPAFKRL